MNRGFRGGRDASLYGKRDARRYGGEVYGKGCAGRGDERSADGSAVDPAGRI